MNTTVDSNQDIWSPLVGLGAVEHQKTPVLAGADSDVHLESASHEEESIESPSSGRNGRLPSGLNRVVVPLDGTGILEEAIPVARLIARRLVLPIHLIGVIDPQRSLPPALAYRAAVSPALFRELLSSRIVEIYKRLEEVAQQLTQEGISVTDVVLRGSIEACMEEATTRGDLVIMALPPASNGTDTRIGGGDDRSFDEARPIVVFRRPRPAISGAIVKSSPADVASSRVHECVEAVV